MCYICLQNPCPPQCPNYEPKNARLYCSFCDEGIYDGEEYIENHDGEYRHYDCFDSMRDLLKWLGYEIMTMEDTHERNYEICE